MNTPPYLGGKAVDSKLVDQQASFSAHSNNHEGNDRGTRSMHRVQGDSSRATVELRRVSAGPTSRRAVFQSSGDAKRKTIDLEGTLTNEERAIILEHALDTESADAEGMLNKIRDRFDMASYSVPKIEVRFEDLHVVASVYTAAGRNVPTVLNVFRDMAEWLVFKLHLYRPNKTKMAILNHISSVLQPGRSTLLLGPPASGKSTLLKMLAGKMEGITSVKKSGKVTYNGRSFDEFLPQSASVYIEQEDQHLPELTVRETMDFSALCQGSGHKSGEVAQLRELEKEKNITPDWNIHSFMTEDAKEKQKHHITTDYHLRMLGLEQPAATIIGSADVRGISGGQKKRVTTAEMVVGPKKVIFADEISTGLDSSTTYDIVKWLRDTTGALDFTTLVALLQPAPETYELFTDVMLLSEGYLVFHGPTDEIQEFFADMGFVCPERKGVADFLQEVTSRKDQHQFWQSDRGAYKFVPVADMVQKFQESRHGMRIKELLAHPAEQGKIGDKHHDRQELLRSNRYAMSGTSLFWFCWQRELTLARRNIFIYGFRFFVTMTMAVVTATAFLRTEIKPDSPAAGNLYFGVLFFSSIMLLFDGFAEETLTVQRLPGFFKQRDNMFYSAAAYVWPTTIIRMPYSLLAATLWSLIVYYPVGLAPEASRFFYFLLALLVLHSMGIGMFRFIASACRNETVAATGGSFFFLVLVLLGGFLLARGDIPDWWIWFYWINPLSYVTQGIAINEFLAPRWQNVPGYGNLGITILQQRGVHTDDWWRWLGIAGGVIGWLAFNIGCWLCHAYLDPLEEHTATLRAEDQEDELLPAIEPLLQDDVETGTNGVSARTMAPQTASARQVSVGKSGKSLSQIISSRASLQGLSRKSLQGQSRNSISERSIGSGNGSPANDTGMVLPFDPLSLTFHNLNYYVPLTKESEEAERSKEKNRIGTHEGKDMLQLLNDCSGAFRPGILTALVGSSGAGKTTLMDVLAGRKTSGVIDGDVRVSGHPKIQQTFARVMGYCEQTDIHSPNITVFESLQFSAELRFPGDVETDIKTAFIEEVLRLVELEAIRGSIVGKPGESGLSVEQRKRLTIAVELVANPSVVFMDEPTSGLDARAAAIVMRTVRNTVNTGRTVVCTIHQPSIDIFEAFDELLLMKPGGRITYHGHLGERSHHLVEYFEGIDGVPKLADGLNPATWMLQISTAGMEANLGKDFADEYKASKLYQKNEQLIERLSVPEEDSEPLHFSSEYSRGYWTQFTNCLWKFERSYWRNAPYNATRFIFATVLALIVGSILYKVGQTKTNQQNIGNILGALYLAVLFLGIINSRTVQAPASYERGVMYRERAAGMYNELPFALAQCMIELPYNLLEAILFSCIAYWMMGFILDAGKFFWFIFVIYLTLNLMGFYGIMGVYVTPNLVFASVLSGFFYGFWNLFAGFIIPFNQCPWWWRWYMYINPVYWALYGIIVTQLGTDDTMITLVGSPDKISVKDFLYQNFNYKYSFIGPVVGILLGFTVFFAALAVLTLRFGKFQKR